MRKGLQLVVLALVTLAALALVPAGAAAADACPRGNHAAIAVYAPRLVHPGEELRVELEGEAVVVDAYQNVVVTVDGVATPVALEGYGTQFVTVRAPRRSQSFEVVVSWDQSANANGEESGGVACSGTTVVNVLAARWSGWVGNLELPRVEGRWRGVWTVPGHSGREPVEFRIAPVCGLGACDVRFAGDPRPARLDDYDVYRMTTRSPTRVSCTLLLPGGGRQVVTGRATEVSSLALRPAGQKRVDGQLVATRLTGRVTFSIVGLRGPVSDCRYPDRSVTLTAVRR